MWQATLGAILVTVGAAGVAAAGANGHTDLTDQRVRSADARIRTLIDQGHARSATFRRLVEDVRSTDVVVHVLAGRLPDGLRGQLSHQVVAAGNVRYLFITVDARAAAPLVISIIAHELHHALEVARVPEVGRSVAVHDFFEAIADGPCRSSRCFETADALRIQEDVVRELD